MYVNIKWNIIQSKKKKKKGNPAICDNMDEPGKHYSKGNKSEREWKIVNDPLICGILKSQTYSNRE